MQESKVSSDVELPSETPRFLRVSPSLRLTDFLVQRMMNPEQEPFEKWWKKREVKEQLVTELSNKFRRSKRSLQGMINNWIETPEYVRKHIEKSVQGKGNPGTLSVNKAMEINSIGRVLGNIPGVWDLFVTKAMAAGSEPIDVKSTVLDSIGKAMKLGRIATVPQLATYIKRGPKITDQQIILLEDEHTIVAQAAEKTGRDINDMYRAAIYVASNHPVEWLKRADELP